jgi:hypothetical protein
MLEFTPGEVKAIVSLLGRKRDGQSEFAFYPFDGGDDERNDGGRYSFRGWLGREYPTVILCEFPTVDFEPVPPETIVAVEAEVSRLLAEGVTVVIVDSGGVQRTSSVARALGAVEDSRTDIS